MTTLMDVTYEHELNGVRSWVRFFGGPDGFRVVTGRDERTLFDVRISESIISRYVERLEKIGFKKK